MIIKVCGMRNEANIQKIAALPIQMMGFVFYDRSPRFVGEVELPTTQGVERIGVFVDSNKEEILRTVRCHALDGVQLHGNEAPELCRTLREMGLKVLKAIPVASAEDLCLAERYEGTIDLLLFDTKCIGFGGSGRSFDWDLLCRYDGLTPFLLSGGLNPLSVEAVRSFIHPRCSGIDLNSGFETAPGIKNVEQLQLFIQKLQSL